VIVENGETLINCLAYVDLNPVRAGIVKRPEDYRRNSLGYHVQTNNKDDFLSLDFGLEEFHGTNPSGIRSAVNNEFHRAGILEAEERLRRYRCYVYETGAVDTGKGGQIDPEILGSSGMSRHLKGGHKWAVRLFHREFFQIKLCSFLEISYRLFDTLTLASRSHLWAQSHIKLVFFIYNSGKYIIHCFTS
jgi:hypothetical protein